MRRCVWRLRRFVPPWERDGKTADDFFAGLMQSSNPLQQQRKLRARAAAAAAAALRDNPVTAEDRRRADERAACAAAALQRERDFLPYGATVRRYYDTTRMAAWGEYTAALQQEGADVTMSSSSSEHAAAQDTSSSSRSSSTDASPMYSSDTRALLLRDMTDKLPYRYTQYVPLPASGSAQWPLHGTAAVVLDVDGVVCRGRELIAGADTAVQTLTTLRVPLLFLSNGSPKSEADKAAELSSLLGCPIHASQVVLAHSPMRAMAPRYRGAPVLVVGPTSCGAIAKSYGFDRVITIEQYQRAHPDMLPYKRWSRDAHVADEDDHDDAAQRRHHGSGNSGNSGSNEGSDGKSDADDVAAVEQLAYGELAAVFQFNDPYDVFSDVQTLLDVFTAPRGQVGRYVCRTQSVPYYVAADDLLWATEAPLPRLGQGAFREMLAAVYASVTGEQLEVTMYGKPRAIAFAYAERRVREVSAMLGWDADALRAIFMVGDNCDTDVLGANAAGGLWTSVHVLSGMGNAPAAQRTAARHDAECEWLETCVPRTPHYVAPTADHFVRELLAFPEVAMLHNKTAYHGKPNPVDLHDTYNFTP